MQVIRFDHHTERALRDEQVAACAASVLDALAATPVPYWRGKSEKQAAKSVLQPVLNAYIEQELWDRGWEREWRATGACDGANGMRVDFCRQVGGGQVVAVEVQLGNVGRFYSDIFKFLHLQAQGRLALAIHVSLTDETANLTDSGLSTHETTLRRVAEVSDTVFEKIPVPLMCLGLTHDGSPIVDFAKSLFPHPRVLQGDGAKTSISHAVAQLRRGVPIEQVSPPSVIRPALRAVADVRQLDLI